MIHEESCETRSKTIAGDLLPESTVDNKANSDEENKSGAKNLTKPSTLQIHAPLITSE